MSSTAWIEEILKTEGLTRFGVAALEEPASIALYEAWLAQGYHGEMTYLEEHLPEKRDPSLLLGQARTAIVMALDYLPHPAPEGFCAGGLQVAAYARGRDYHHFLKGRIDRVIARLKEARPEESFVGFTDSSPVLERDLAARAGLGWVGKNNCLISRSHGSMFFIAEIYTTLDLPIARLPAHDHCGTCTRCLDACPTGALIAPRTLDARKCISYLTIESREVPALELRAKTGEWFFGCDICQTVCPWNVKAHGPAPALNARAEVIEDLRKILVSSHRELERRFEATALARAGGWGLKRNALVVAGNLRAHELENEIGALLLQEKLGDLAAWALRAIARDES